MEFLSNEAGVDGVSTFVKELKEVKPNQRYRVGYYQAKNWFLTFPRSDVEKSVVLERLLAMDNKLSIVGVMIAQERHGDGGKHLHVGLWLKKSIRLRADYFDALVEKHGNYARIRSVVRAVKYLQKEDPSPLVHGDVPLNGVEPTPKLKITDEVVSMLKDGKDPNAVFQAFPGFYMMHRQKVDGMFHQLQAWQGTKDLRPWKELVYTGDCNATRQVVDWLNKNIKKPRHHKQQQLYIYGPPNTHKSTLLNQLSRYLRTYDIPVEDFYDMYPTPEPELIVMDEFKGQKTIQFLNQFVEGVPMTLRVKGGQKMKKANPPVIICSNASLDSIYHKKAEANSVYLAALRTRFLEVCLGTEDIPIKLDVAALFAEDESASLPLSVDSDSAVYL